MSPTLCFLLGAVLGLSTGVLIPLLLVRWALNISAADEDLEQA